MERLVADETRILNSDHPSALATRIRLVYAYWDTGNTREAVAVGEALVADCERVLGSEHPRSLPLVQASPSRTASSGTTDGRWLRSKHC